MVHRRLPVLRVRVGTRAENRPTEPILMVTYWQRVDKPSAIPYGCVATAIAAWLRSGADNCRLSRKRYSSDSGNPSGGSAAMPLAIGLGDDDRVHGGLKAESYWLQVLELAAMLCWVQDPPGSRRVGPIARVFLAT